ARRACEVPVMMARRESPTVPSANNRVDGRGLRIVVGAGRLPGAGRGLLLRSVLLREAGREERPRGDREGPLRSLSGASAVPGVRPGHAGSPRGLGRDERDGTTDPPAGPRPRADGA